MSLIHLARRGLEAAVNSGDASYDSHSSFRSTGNDGSGDGDGDGVELNPFAAIVLSLTALGFMLLLFGIQYTYGHLLPTLCMVESPETAAYLPVDALSAPEGDTAAPPAYEDTGAVGGGLGQESAAAAAGTSKPDDMEMHLLQNKPVTASLRATILHLRNRAGYWSRFRGLSVYMVWNIGVNLVVSLLVPSFQLTHLYSRIGLILAQVATCTILMTWIHIVISEPSSKRWYRRIPSIRTWPKIAPAVALWSVATQLVGFLPMLICGSFGSLGRLNDPEYNPDKRDLYAIGAQGLFGMLIFLLLFVLIEVPATVTMVRVAASMLPEEDETIVSFDRTFGGKTTPAIVGGSGKIGLIEAWRSFPWASRIRLLKLVAKVALIVLSVWISMLLTLTIEAHLLLGDSLGHAMKGVHDAVGPR